MDGLHKGLAQVESALSGTGTSRDEKVHVGEDVPLGVDAGYVRQAGGNHRQGAEDKHIGIGIRVADIRNPLKEAGKRAFDGRVEGGHQEPFATITSIVSISSISLDLREVRHILYGFGL